MIIKIKLLAAYNKGYSFHDELEDLESILLDLELSMSELDTISSISESEIHDSNYSDIFSSWSRAEKASGILLPFLIDLNSSIYDALPEGEKVPF